MREFIDASIFLGMHSIDNNKRIACKNFFIRKLAENSTIYFHLEQVGICDSIIWNFPINKQNSYYPFMDMLHTIMKIEYVNFLEIDLKNTIDFDIKIKNISDKLMVTSIINKKGKLYTANIDLNKKHSTVNMVLSQKENELSFPNDIEKLYQNSLELKIAMKGIIPPLITPLNENNNVCEKSVENLINYVSPYSVALMPTLSSGEGWALSLKQFIDMISYTIKYSKIPVIVGIEVKTTEEVIERAKIAKDIGASAIIVTTPFISNISQEDIYNHYNRITKAVNIPIWIYNESEISGTEIEIATISKICKLENIVGIKEASGSVKFINALKIPIPIYQGWEHLCIDSKKVDGYILPLSNLEPKLCQMMFNNPTEENQDKINDLSKKYNLMGKEWYKGLKKELVKRGTISTNKLLLDETNR